MGKITVNITDETEEELRTFLRRKGDLGALVERALVALIKEKKEEAGP